MKWRNYTDDDDAPQFEKIVRQKPRKERDEQELPLPKPRVRIRGIFNNEDEE